MFCVLSDTTISPMRSEREGLVSRPVEDETQTMLPGGEGATIGVEVEEDWMTEHSKCTFYVLKICSVLSTQIILCSVAANVVIIIIL